MKYIRFDSKSWRDEIVKIGNELTQFLYDNSIDNIIFIDRAARPGYIALKKSWKQKFPDKNVPNIYFTNPNGYNTEFRNIEDISEEFCKVYKKLSLDKTVNIMLFDVCMHTGNSFEKILKVLEKRY